MTHDPNLRPILVVDDDLAGAELTIAALSEIGLANPVLVINDGEAALDYLHQRGEYANQLVLLPLVVLLDLKMPKVDGLDILREIRATPRLKSIPVVMLTSSDQERDIVESYALGTNAYVVKPVNIPDFITAIKSLGLFWALLNRQVPSQGG